MGGDGVLNSGSFIFTGKDGAECEDWIQSIQSEAFSRGKSNDNAWIAYLAATRISGAALRWYCTQNESTTSDWFRLRAAFLNEYPNDPTEDQPMERPSSTNPSTVPTPAAAPPSGALAPAGRPPAAKLLMEANFDLSAKLASIGRAVPSKPVRPSADSSIHTRAAASPSDTPWPTGGLLLQPTGFLTPPTPPTRATASPSNTPRPTGFLPQPTGFSTPSTRATASPSNTPWPTGLLPQPTGFSALPTRATASPSNTPCPTGFLPQPTGFLTPLIRAAPSPGNFFPTRPMSSSVPNQPQSTEADVLAKLKNLTIPSQPIASTATTNSVGTTQSPYTGGYIQARYMSGSTLTEVYLYEAWGTICCSPTWKKGLFFQFDLGTYEYTGSITVQGFVGSGPLSLVWNPPSRLNQREPPNASLTTKRPANPEFYMKVSSLRNGVCELYYGSKPDRLYSLIWHSNLVFTTDPELYKLSRAYQSVSDVELRYIPMNE